MFPRSDVRGKEFCDIKYCEVNTNTFLLQSGKKITGGMETSSATRFFAFSANTAVSQKFGGNKLLLPSVNFSTESPLQKLFFLKYQNHFDYF